MDGRGIAAAFALGAEGVQLGTAFLACPESAASELHKNQLAETPDGGTAVTDVFTGRYARAIRTRLAEELAHVEVDVLPFPVQSFFVEPSLAPRQSSGGPSSASSSRDRQPHSAGRWEPPRSSASSSAKPKRSFAGLANSPKGDV